MTPDQTQLWILDTIAEGGYSFVELSDYVSNHEIDTNALILVLDRLLREELIYVRVVDPDSDNIALPFLEELTKIENLENIVRKEKSEIVKHFLYVSKKGRTFLINNGIVH